MADENSPHLPRVKVNEGLTPLVTPVVGRFTEHATAIPLSSATLKEAIESAIRAGDYKVARDLFRITPGQ